MTPKDTPVGVNRDTEHTEKVRIKDISEGSKRLITWVITFQKLDSDEKWKCEMSSKHPLIKALGYIPGQYPLQPNTPVESLPLLNVTVKQLDPNKPEAELIYWKLVE